MTTQALVPDISDLVSRAQANVAEFNLKRQQEEQQGREEVEQQSMRELGDKLIAWLGGERGDEIFHALKIEIQMCNHIVNRYGIKHHGLRVPLALFTYKGHDLALDLAYSESHLQSDSLLLHDLESERWIIISRDKDGPDAADCFLDAMASFAADLDRAQQAE